MALLEMRALEQSDAPPLAGELIASRAEELLIATK